VPTFSKAVTEHLEDKKIGTHWLDHTRISNLSSPQ